MIKYLVLYIESASQYSTRKQAIRYRKFTAIQSASQYAVQIVSQYRVSLVPSPSFFAHTGKKKEGPGIHCLRMCWIFMEFHETVNYAAHSRIFSS